MVFVHVVFIDGVPTAVFKEKSEANMFARAQFMRGRDPSHATVRFYETGDLEDACYYNPPECRD